MSDAFYPRRLRRSLLEDPDLPETIRNAEPYLDYSGSFPTPNPKPVAPPPEMPTDGPLGPARTYEHAFQKPNMRPVAPPPDMPAEGPLGRALDYGRTFRAKPEEERTALKARGANAWQESGMQVLGGADDMLRDTLTAIEPAIAFIEARSPITVPRYKGFAIAQAETGHGAVLRDASYVLSQLLPLTSALRAARIGGGAADIAVSAVQGYTRDPAEPSFLDFVQKHAEIRGPVYAFFNADPNDSTAFRRLENALESVLGAEVAKPFARLSVLAAQAANGGRKLPPVLEDIIGSVPDFLLGQGLDRLHTVSDDPAALPPSADGVERP